MALLEDMVLGWGSGALISVGAVVAAPLVLPRIGALLRPVVKGLMKGYFAVTDTLGGSVTEGEQAPVARPAQARATRYSRAQPQRRGQAKRTRTHAKRQTTAHARAA
jgi:hypothetical protein